MARRAKHRPKAARRGGTGITRCRKLVVLENLPTDVRPPILARRASHATARPATPLLPENAPDRALFLAAGRLLPSHPGPNTDGPNPNEVPL